MLTVRLLWCSFLVLSLMPVPFDVVTCHMRAGQEYIEEARNESGVVVGFHCKLCECKFTDPNAKQMHMKGRRHRFQYKVRVLSCRLHTLQTAIPITEFLLDYNSDLYLLVLPALQRFLYGNIWCIVKFSFCLCRKKWTPIYKLTSDLYTIVD